MSLKKRDEHNRWRNKTIAFRMSPEENEQLNQAVKLSGLTKQDYIIHRVLQRNILVKGSPRMHKALKEQMEQVLLELKRIENGAQIDTELLDLIRLIHTTLYGMKGDEL